MPQRQQPCAFYSRKQASILLGRTIATLVAMEKDGTLEPVRLRPRPHSPVLYRRVQIDAIINGPAEAK